MSTIKANAYLDSAGGNTATINGITPALASQAEAQAGTDNTKLMTPLRVDQAILALTDAAVVGAATAGLAAGSVGSYAFCRISPNTTAATGSTVAGSSLIYSNASGGSDTGVPAGSWRVMGRTNSTSAAASTTLMLRIL